MMFGMGAQGTGANRLQRSRNAQHGTAERIFPMDLGSGRAHHRERDRERRPRFTGVQPPGPETASEWSDALEDIFGRMRAMNSSLASHAHELARLKEQQTGTSQKIQEVETAVDRRILEGGERFRVRLDQVDRDMREGYNRLNNDLRMAMNYVQHSSAQPPNSPSAAAPGVEQFSCATPIGGSPPRPGRDNGNSDGASSPQSPDFGSPSHASPTNQQQHNNGSSQCYNNVDLNNNVGNSNPFRMRGPPRYDGDGNSTAADESYRGSYGPRHHNSYESRQRHFPAQPEPAYYHHQSSGYGSAPTPTQDWKISKKGVGDLPIFNATHKAYKFWKDKVSDHAAENNPEWRDLLRHAEAQGTPITPNVL